MPERVNERIARDWERLCDWMEPKPEIPFAYWDDMPSPKGFWQIAIRNCNQVWVYSEPSLDLCALAEAEVERRGLASVYLDSLEDMRFREIASGHEPVTLRYFLLRLTPAQRCAALLAAIGDVHV